MNRKEYEEYMGEQMKILHGHFSRCMLRCLNKLNEVEEEINEYPLVVKSGKDTKANEVKKA